MSLACTSLPLGLKGRWNFVQNYKCRKQFTFLFHLQAAALKLPIFFLISHFPTVTKKQNTSLLGLYSNCQEQISSCRNTAIHKTLTYASETWILTKRDRKQINIFERKVYRRILGPVNDNEKKYWRILTNKEMYAMVKKPTITETIRLNRLCWFGYVQRMEENRIPKKVKQSHYRPGGPQRVPGS